MHEPPKSKQLPGNPFAIHGAQGGPEAQALLALAWEIRTLTMLEHPHVEHEETLTRLTGEER